MRKTVYSGTTFEQKKRFPATKCTQSKHHQPNIAQLRKLQHKRFTNHVPLTQKPVATQPFFRHPLE